MGHLSYEDRQSWDCSTWRRLQGDLIAALQYLEGVLKNRITDIRKKSFTMRMLRHWHSLLREVMDAPSL